MDKGIPELLAPAGGPAEFNAALAAGADAIYCGYGHTFNARRGAQSFDAQTFGDACDKAHLAGARVYVTVNVVIRDDEMPSVLALVRRAWLLGADAFIVQDWGLLCEVHRLWPQIELHVSTQANVHDARAVEWCRTLGAERVTLSRELSLAEIAHIAQTGVELESFCHGAICFCYSGICHMSSSAGDRSANRGACAQPCRLPYELVDERGEVLTSPDRGRPLCPKDFYSFDNLAELVQTGVGSLKVEGRLKGPDYVYAVVSAYRGQLDDIAAGRMPDAGAMDDRRMRLKRAFNRDFTNAYLMGTSGDEMMSYERSNNRGELVGSVVEARSLGKVKARRGGSGGGRERVRTFQVAEVDVLLNKPVGKGDLLEVRPMSDPTQFVTAHAQADAQAGDVIVCRVPRAVEQGSLVRVIRSQQALDLGEKAAEAQIPRKRPVKVRIYARKGETFEVCLTTFDGVSAHAQGPVMEAARTRAVSAKDLISHVGRMGATPFEATDFAVELDEGCGMGFSAVHAVRAEACEALQEALLSSYRQRSLAPYRRAAGNTRVQKSSDSILPAPAIPPIKPRICALVADPASARAAKEAGATILYAPVDAMAWGSWPADVVPVLDEVSREADHARLDSWVEAGKAVAVGTVSELVLAHERGAAAELRTCIPVHNRAGMDVLAKAGASVAWLSPELSLDEISCLAEEAPLELGIVAYGRPRVMTSEHCVLQAADRCCHDCARCILRHKKTYLRTGKDEFMPVQTDLEGRSRIYAAHVTDITPSIPELFAVGVTRFCADCTLLTPSQTREAVARLVHPSSEAEPDSTTAHPLKPGGEVP